uniref:hypothetical protein n=1 Tax=Alistipes putredinis TaxID=28117 RepID=UPI003FD7DEB9
MTVHPAPENSGIVFRRIDLEGKPEIPWHHPTELLVLRNCSFPSSRKKTMRENGLTTIGSDCVSR